jgi:hypothetical protein
MVHGDDDGAPGIPVHNAFHANLFADHFQPPFGAALIGATRRQQKSRGRLGATASKSFFG